MKKIIAPLLLLFSIACRPTIISPVFDEPFTLYSGQTANLSNGPSITFLEALDSRCPDGTQCIRAGELIARLAISRNDDKKEVLLCVTGECEANTTNMYVKSGDKIEMFKNTYIVKIEGAGPQKTTTASIKQASYFVKLRILKP